MRKVSAKQRVKNDVRSELLHQWFEEAANDPGNYTGVPMCEIHWGPGCTGRATEGHEPQTRGRGGSIVDRRNVFLTCRFCHRSVHAHPREAAERGFLVPSWLVGLPSLPANQPDMLPDK